MRTLTFLVNKQHIEKHGDFSGLVAGTSGYLYARFGFSNDWNGYRRVAVFTCNGQEYPALIKSGICQVPEEVAACLSFKVHVVGKRGDDVIRSGRATVIQRRY